MKTIVQKWLFLWVLWVTSPTMTESQNCTLFLCKFRCTFSIHWSATITQWIYWQQQKVTSLIKKSQFFFFFNSQTYNVLNMSENMKVWRIFWSTTKWATSIRLNGGFLKMSITIQRRVWETFNSSSALLQLTVLQREVKESGCFCSCDSGLRAESNKPQHRLPTRIQTSLLTATWRRHFTEQIHQFVSFKIVCSIHRHIMESLQVNSSILIQTSSQSVSLTQNHNQRKQAVVTCQDTYNSVSNNLNPPKPEIKHSLTRCGGALQFPDTDHRPTPLKAARHSYWPVDSFRIRTEVSIISFIHSFIIFHIFQSGFWGFSSRKKLREFLYHSSHS